MLLSRNPHRRRHALLLPEHVRFAMQASRRITHVKRIEDGACALCDTDDETDPAAPNLVATAPWGYLPLGKPGCARSELEALRTAARKQVLEDVFVSFEHEEDGTSPKLAARFPGGLARPRTPSF